MTLKEYELFFDGLGYKVHAVVETPLANLREWQNDFEIIDGKEFPSKRMTLLALK